MTHPVYDESNGQDLDHDAAFCVLSEAVTDVPITPVLFSCGIRELFYQQDQVAFVGFGQHGSGTSGIKRWAETIVSSDVTDTQQSILLGGPGNSACPGDSGGPAYLRMPDGVWHSFGITSFGTSAGCGGTPTSYVMPHAFLDWIEGESGIDITPCGDADGTWAPTEECTGFSMDPTSTAGSWDTGCQHEVSGPLAMCGPAFDEEPDTTGPAVSLINPVDQSEFDTDLAEFTVQFEASDEWGVREVRMLINGEDAGVSVTRGDYAFDAAFPTGTYSLQATATDWSGNVGTSAIVNIGVGVEPEAPADTGASEDDGSGGSDGGDEAGSDGGTDEGGTGGAGESESEGGCSVAGRTSPAPLALALGLLLIPALRRRRD